MKTKEFVASGEWRKPSGVVRIETVIVASGGTGSFKPKPTLLKSIRRWITRALA